jgi:hypothetical protein
MRFPPFLETQRAQRTQRKSKRILIAQDPKALGPRILLSQALLREGRDWPAAEKALREVLDLDADNKDARHNLDLLQRRQPRRPGGTKPP